MLTYSVNMEQMKNAHVNKKAKRPPEVRNFIISPMACKCYIQMKNAFFVEIGL